MYFYIFKISAIGFNTLAALITVASHGVNAQHFSNLDLNQSNQFFNEAGEASEPVNVQRLPNFTDLNQSSQFFIEGNKQIEREIKLLQQDLKLPEIEIPENSYRSQDIQNSDSVYAEAKLQPMSEKVASNWELSCSFWQIMKCNP